MSRDFAVGNNFVSRPWRAWPVVLSAVYVLQNEQTATAFNKVVFSSRTRSFVNDNNNNIRFLELCIVKYVCSRL